MSRETVYDALCVADYFIRKALPAGLDPLQVMKLSYIAHGFTLALKDKPLIDDDVEAWQFGPVIRRIYNKLPGGARKITQPLLDAPAEIEGADKAILDGVFNKYGSRSGLALSSLTHSKGSPWAKTWQAYGKNAVIPQELIERHYKNVLRRFEQEKAEGRQYAPSAL